MTYAYFTNILSGSAITSQETGSIANVAQNYSTLNFQAAVYGTDQADGTIKYQGSIDNLSWTTINTVTFAVGTTYVLISFPSTTQVVLTGNAVAALAANPTFYISGSSTNDGRKTASATELQTLMTYSSLIGVFTIGETVTGSISGATGVVVFKTGTASLRVNAVTGVFDAADSLTGGTSGATADVDVATIVTQVTTTGITVEAVAGSAWSGAQTGQVLSSTAYLYYRAVIAKGTNTKGFVDCIGVGKAY